jgi:hypothetical protein
MPGAAGGAGRLEVSFGGKGARAGPSAMASNLIDPDPNACRFHGRCPIGQDLRRILRPPPRELRDGGRAARHSLAGAAA